MNEMSQLQWYKSSYSSANGQCVEVAHLPSLVAVRDSKNPDASALVVPLDSWAMFLGNIKNGRIK